MTGHRFEEFLKDAAQGYNRPPETPRDAMWETIRERLESSQAARADDARVIPLRRRWRTGLALGVALAATLAIGFGLGRITGALGPAAVPAGHGPLASGAEEPAEAGLPYRLAANEHFGRAEAMLTMFRSGGAGVEEETVQWARDLLVTTRLLLDSPAARDVQMRDLLEDLELVLVQIASLPSGETGREAQLARSSLEDRDLLLKLRAVPVEASQTGI